MLRINFLAKNITDEETIQFFNAIKYAGALTEGCMIQDSIDRQTAIYKNEKGTYSASRVEQARLSLIDLNKRKAELIAICEETKEYYQKVLNNMIVPDKKGHSNTIVQVQNVLSVIACAETPKLYKYAITGKIDAVAYINTMDNIHIATITQADKNGMIDSEAVKASYLKSAKELDVIIRDAFSLPIATPYTKPIRVRLNNTDRRILHESYVKGFTVKTTKYKDATAVSEFVLSTGVRKTKDGALNISSLLSDICKVVVSHYSVNATVLQKEKEHDKEQEKKAKAKAKKNAKKAEKKAKADAEHVGESVKEALTA